MRDRDTRRVSPSRALIFLASITSKHMVLGLTVKKYNHQVGVMIWPKKVSRSRNTSSSRYPALMRTKKNSVRIVKPLRCQNNEMPKLNKSSFIFVLTTCTSRATSIWLYLLPKRHRTILAKKTVLFNNYLLPLRATLVITDTKVRGSSKAKRTLSFLGLEVLRSPSFPNG